MTLRCLNMTLHVKNLLMYILLILFTLGSSDLTGQCIVGNCSNGKGTYLFKDGSTYGGAFQNYFPHGYGKIKYKNGNAFEGQWVRGKKSGTGTFWFKNGNVYKGQFHEDVISGNGMMKYKNGDTYTGTWQKNKPHGQGIYSFASGESYDGEFLSGQFHGTGIFTEKDGSRFEGVFMSGKREGSGKLIKPDGITMSQTYKNNAPVWQETGFATNPEAGQHSYNEPLKDCRTNFCHETTGFYVYGDGARYEGWFENGIGQGQGICTYANGDRYEGEWANHAPHGTGIMFSANGKTVQGFWQNGEWIRENKTEFATEKTKPAVNPMNQTKNAPKMYALVVGVALYNHTKSLKYTDDDAYRVYAFLKSPEGGALRDEQITLLIDEAATRSSILTAMDQISRKAGKDDIIFVYLSGHGLQGTFVPHDFDGRNNLIAYREFLDKMESSAGKHKIFITDACHSGSMLASAKSPLDDQIALFYEQFEQTKSSTAFISSSKSEEVSLEHGGMRQGIFSHYLIRGLKGEANSNQDKVVTVGELYRFISSGVKKYTAGAQNPVISGTYDPGMPVAMVRI